MKKLRYNTKITRFSELTLPLFWAEVVGNHGFKALRKCNVEGLIFVLDGVDTPQLSGYQTGKGKGNGKGL